MKTLAIALLLLAAPVSAQSQTPAPTRDFTQPLLGFDGKPVPDKVTIGQKAAECLFIDPKAQPGEKAKEYFMANRIRDNAAWPFDAAEAVLLETCANNNEPPLVAGQILHLLEPEKYPDK